MIPTANYIINPMRKFLQRSSSIGIIIIVCTAASLFFANWSVTSSHYIYLFEHHLLHINSNFFPNTIKSIVGDGLMTLFFFYVGMEMRRELCIGELASVKKAMFPIIGAIGGIIVPALIFIIISYNNKNIIDGWGIPTATDVSFSIAIASLLGKKVPLSIKLFITSLAIIDDLGSVIIITLFYGQSFSMYWFVAAFFIIIAMRFSMFIKNFPRLIHILLSIILWYCLFHSGVNAVFAGIISAFTMPLEKIKALENKLHTIIYFFIFPLFVITNTDLLIAQFYSAPDHITLALSVILSLIIGKPLGICLFCYAFIKLKLIHLPFKTNWNMMIGAGLLASIGFSMSIFIATIVYDGHEETIAKICVLIAALIGTIFSIAWFTIMSKKIVPQEY